MQELVERSYAASDHRTVVLALLGALALVLAAVGVYGTFAYRVAQRTQKIGVLMALGADPRQILRQVLSHAMRLAAAGLCAGLLLSVILTPLARALLFHVSPVHPWALATATLLVVVMFGDRGLSAGPSCGARRPDYGASV